jgi:hypothetical protein
VVKSRASQPGDIIDPVHLEEIIAAVEFFLDHGVWLTMPTYSMRWSPAGVGGLDCGRELAEIIGGSPLFGCYERDRINASWLCCSESNPCPGGSWDDCQGRHERCILAQGQSEWSYYIDHYAYGVFQEHCRFKSLNCNATGASPVGGGSHSFETEINSGPDHDPSISATGPVRVQLPRRVGDRLVRLPLRPAAVPGRAR